jgi:hypothetical protein
MLTRRRQRLLRPRSDEPPLRVAAQAKCRITSEASSSLVPAVVPVVAVDQQLHARVLVLPDAVDRLGHGADKARNDPRAMSRSRFAATVAESREISQLLLYVFSIAS